MQSRAIVILGGGVGGLVAANEIRRLLPATHRITVIDKNPLHAFAPSFLWLMTGARTTSQITRELPSLLRPGIEFMPGNVEAIDPDLRQVLVGAERIAYDYLVVALGAELCPEVVPGLGESAHTFYTYEGAADLRETLLRFRGGRVAVVVSSLPYKCPAAPHEAAMLIADVLRKQGLGKRTELHLFTPEAQPMPVAGPQLGQAVKQMLESRGIAFHPLCKLTAVETERREIAFDGGESFAYNLLVAIPPHRAPRVVREAGLTNEAGWVPVDSASLMTRDPRVYALGDVTSIPIRGRWKPDMPLMLPKAGVFAHAQAKVVAERITAEIRGTESNARFCGEGYCMLEAGEDLAGFAFGNFFGETAPEIQLRQIGKAWHWGKVLFEKWWLSPFGMNKRVLNLALRLGAKAYGIPVVL